MDKLIENIEKLHTTELGALRVCDNLLINPADVVEWCKEQIMLPGSIHTRRGKNWYVTVGDIVITITATSMTIITAHRLPQ